MKCNNKKKFKERQNKIQRKIEKNKNMTHKSPSNPLKINNIFFIKALKNKNI